MSERIGVDIVAKDGASKVFQEVSRSADKMGAEIEQAAKQSSLSLKEIGDHARNVGLGLGVLAGAAALSGKAFRDQQVALATLSRGYGDAADEMQRFADQIQGTTNFSNDAAVASANIFRTLSENYGFTADQIQQLISISADLAASMGIGLEDAAMRVQSAMRGEAEAAEYLGLTLNDRALGLDRVSASMSEAERAQVRFNALQEQSAFAMGAAAEQAQSTYGAMTQIRDSVQDAAQSFGDFLGPLGEVGAFAADNVIQIAAMGLALGQLGSAAKSLNTLTEAMTGVSLASRGMSLAFGPVGIAAAGLVAVGGGIYMLAQALKADLPQASQEAIDSMQDLINTIVEAGDQSEYAITLLRLDDVMQANKAAIDLYSGSAEELARVQQELYESFDASKVAIEDMAAPLDAPIFEGLTDKQKELIDTNNDLLISVAELQAATENWKATAESAEVVSDGLAAGLDELGEIWRMTGDAGQFAQSEAQAYIDALLAGEISASEFERMLQALITGYENTGEAALASGEAISTNTGVLGQWMTAGGEVKTLTDDIAKSMHDLGEASVDLGAKLIASTDPFVIRQSKMLAGMQAQMTAMGQLSVQLGMPGDDGSFDAAFQGVKASANEAAEAQKGLEAGIAAAANAMTYQVGESQRLAAELEKQSEAAQKLQEQYAKTFADMQARATQATDTLDDVFRAIVGNTDAIASQSQAVMDWADELIGAEGTWAKIDDLMASGAITMEDYTAAQGAYNQIAAANASIQEDVLSIQTQLAPVVATATEALAAQMDELANGSTDAQLFALGMMDAATSSQALALAQGYLQNQEVFGPMIQQAAELNPMLAQILEEMGLISYNPATGVVELLGVDEAQSDLDLLTAAMEELNETVATLIAILQDDASGPLGDLEGKLIALDGSTYIPTVTVEDSASGILAGVSSMLASLDGQTATTYITTVRQEVLQTLSPFALGGVAGYDSGGVVIRAGEAGPERLDFPNGMHGLAVNDGYYQVPVGTYVHTAPATETGNWGSSALIGELHVHATGSDEEIAERVTRVIVPAIQRAMRQHVRASGGV